MAGHGRAAATPTPPPGAGTSLELVGQVIEVMARVLRHYLPDGEAGPVVADADGTPNISVSIATSGGQIDVVTWVFSPSLARAVTAAMARGAGLTDCVPVDAACELANVMLGNAAQVLEAAGLALELAPPVVAAVECPDDASEFTVATPHGRMRVFIQPGGAIS